MANDPGFAVQGADKILMFSSDDQKLSGRFKQNGSQCRAPPEAGREARTVRHSMPWNADKNKIKVKSEKKPNLCSRVTKETVLLLVFWHLSIERAGSRSKKEHVP